MSSAYMPVLFALAGGASLSQKALAEQASVEQPTMTNTLKRMERDGIIKRETDPNDGRATLVSLTAVGKQKLTGVRTAGHAVNDVAMSALTPAERERSHSILRQVIAALEADG